MKETRESWLKQKAEGLTENSEGSCHAGRAISWYNEKLVSPLNTNGTFILKHYCTSIKLSNRGINDIMNTITNLILSPVLSVIIK